MEHILSFSWKIICVMLLNSRKFFLGSVGEQLVKVTTEAKKLIKALKFELKRYLHLERRLKHSS